jgi:hypothetical protein
LRAQATRKTEIRKATQASERRNKPTISNPCKLKDGEPHAHAAREDRGLMVKIPW